MKLLLLITFLAFSSVPAFAYIDETVAGEAETPAGDQNTNLYRLNSAGGVILKKLKKIDDMLSRPGADVGSVDLSSVERILFSNSSDEGQNDAIILNDTLKNVISRVKEVKLLSKPKPTEEQFTQLRKMSSICVRDSDIALGLRTKIRRR